MGNLYAIQQLDISVENYIRKKQRKDKNNKKIDELSYEKPLLITLQQGIITTLQNLRVGPYDGVGCTQVFSEINKRISLFIRRRTGKSLSEPLIPASTNPQYDKRLFIDLPVPTRKLQAQNMLCT